MGSTGSDDGLMDNHPPVSDPGDIDLGVTGSLDTDTDESSRAQPAQPATVMSSEGYVPL